MSAKETSIWSYPQLINSKKTLQRLSRTSIKEDLCLLNDGEVIIILLGKMYKDPNKDLESVQGFISQVVKECRYNGGIFQSIVVVKDKSSINCV